ncbi:MAG: hypothetical protein VX344_02755, partial [Bacteroidota bacterium]|nr:hypothetical protein [Bacteroidota bacterium]
MFSSSLIRFFSFFVFFIFLFQAHAQNASIDCNNIENGQAYFDNCGNCVGGDTGQEPCILFTPEVSVSLSSLVQGSTSDLTFTITQGSNEADIASSIITTDGGSFDISSLTV